MIDEHRARLSVWDGDTCHYLCGDRPDDAVDLGWNVYPGWSVSETSTAVAAAREWEMAGRLVPTRPASSDNGRPEVTARRRGDVVAGDPASLREYDARRQG